MANVKISELPAIKLPGENGKDIEHLSCAQLIVSVPDNSQSYSLRLDMALSPVSSELTTSRSELISNISQLSSDCSSLSNNVSNLSNYANSLCGEINSFSAFKCTSPSSISSGVWNECSNRIDSSVSGICSEISSAIAEFIQDTGDASIVAEVLSGQTSTDGNHVTRGLAKSDTASMASMNGLPYMTARYYNLSAVAHDDASDTGYATSLLDSPLTAQLSSLSVSHLSCIYSLIDSALALVAEQAKTISILSAETGRLKADISALSSKFDGAHPGETLDTQS